ncbi:hypothetical protein ACHAWF_018635 [Thalassiosira exigua]
MTSRPALLFLVASAPSIAVSSFSSPRPRRPSPAPALGAMERLHDPASNAFGPSAEHVYALSDIDAVTRKVADDEWTALGSAVPEAMYETILDVGEEALGRRGWVERTSLTDRIAEEVSKTVEKAIHKIRFQPSAVFDQCPHPLPEELLISLNVLLRHELGAIAGLEEGASFNYSGRDLSVLVLSSVSEAVESYCGVANVDAPFFNLSNEMERRIRDRRRELLVKHSKGYESVNDVTEDVERSRREWVRETLGKKAASHYEFGEVTTKDGNEHSHEKEKRARRRRHAGILNALFQDLDGVLMP